MQADIDHFWCP